MSGLYNNNKSKIHTYLQKLHYYFTIWNLHYDFHCELDWFHFTPKKQGVNQLDLCFRFSGFCWCLKVDFLFYCNCNVTVLNLIIIWKEDIWDNPMRWIFCIRKLTRTTKAKSQGIWYVSVFFIEIVIHTHMKVFINKIKTK